MFFSEHSVYVKYKSVKSINFGEDTNKSLELNFWLILYNMYVFIVILVIFWKVVSVAMQLYCIVVYLVTTLLQIFHRMCLWKKHLKIGQFLATMWTKVCGLLFGPPLYSWRRTMVRYRRLMCTVNPRSLVPAKQARGENPSTVSLSSAASYQLNLCLPFQPRTEIVLVIVRT